MEGGVIWISITYTSAYTCKLEVCFFWTKQRKEDVHSNKYEIILVKNALI
jgi:hypothetical protein